MAKANAPQIDSIRVEVAYSLPDRQCIIALEVRQGTTALEAAESSGIINEFPQIDLRSAMMGIFSKALDGKVLPLPQDYQLRPRDRVEIYRPLIADPKVARAQRAARAKQSK